MDSIKLVIKYLQLITLLLVERLAIYDREALVNVVKYDETVQPNF